MKEKALAKNIVLLTGFSALLLSSCGQTITRTKAVELLSEVVEHVQSKDFVLPTEWSLESAYKGTLNSGNLTYTGSANSSYNFSLTDNYFHSTLTVDGKIGTPLTLAFTSEEWAYTDIQTISGAKTYFVIHALDDGYAGKKSFSITSYGSDEGAEGRAKNGFQSLDAVQEEMKRTDDLSSVPSSLKDTLSSLSSVKSESYSTSGEYSFSSSLTYVSEGSEIHNETTIKDSLLTSVIASEDTLSGHVSYSWGRYKNSKPDLSTYTEESSLESTALTGF